MHTRSTRAAVSRHSLDRNASWRSRSPTSIVPAVADPTVSRPQGAAFFPALFVLLWSTGFIAAKYGLPYAPPLTFLLYRFLLGAALMTVVALATRAPWPRARADYVHVAIAALLVHGLYLGGVFVALDGGMPAGTSAMLVGL